MQEIKTNESFWQQMADKKNFRQLSYWLPPIQGELCRKVFSLCLPVFSTFWLLFGILVVREKIDDSYPMLITLIVLTYMATVYLDRWIYDRAVGPSVRQRGWNENSFWRAAQLLLVMLLLGRALPLALMSIYDSFTKF